MNTETYDELPIPKSLKENRKVEFRTYGEEQIALDPPPNVELKITYTKPGIRGDTACGTTKPATVETRAVVLVPLFINQDTASG